MLCSISGRSSWQPGLGGRLVRLGFVWCPGGMVTIAGVCKTTVLLAMETLKLREAEPSIRSRDDRIAEPGCGLRAWAWTLVFSAQTLVLSTVDSTPSLHSHSGHKSPAMPPAQGAAAFPSFLVSVFYVLTVLQALLALIWLKRMTLFLFCFGLV